jgi:hypothetical protein
MIHQLFIIFFFLQGVTLTLMLEINNTLFSIAQGIMLDSELVLRLFTN